jgi:hypothetical protein
MYNDVGQCRGCPIRPVQIGNYFSEHLYIELIKITSPYLTDFGEALSMVHIDRGKGMIYDL